MITGIYSAASDSIPILYIIGQTPRENLDKEGLQVIDFASIAKLFAELTVTIMEPAQLPGILQKAIYLMGSDRPRSVLIDHLSHYLWILTGGYD